ncbi:MAG: amino acid permease [Candidatus Brocadiia bacterium]
MSLKRELGFLDVFSVAAGAMISSGLFVLPAVVFRDVGPGAFLCYLLAALLLIPSVLSKAELITAMPKAGGTYYFIDRSLGPAAGTVGGVAAWASLAFKSAFALLGIGIVAGTVWGWDVAGWQVKAVACGSCLLFAGVNLLGARHAGRVQMLLVAVLLLILVGYVAGGAGSVDVASFRPLLPRGWQSLLLGTGSVFIAFAGVTKVATMGEEVKRPKRDLVAGMFAACALVSLLYVLSVVVTTGLLPIEAGEWTGMPLSQGAGALWGRTGAGVLGFAAICAFLTTGNAGIYSASRTLMAMSQDELMPRPLGHVGSKRGVPTRAIVMTALFMVAVLCGLSLERLVKAASAMQILLFMFEMGSVILMRESRIPTYQPTWRSPLYPWLQIFGILVYGFLLVELGTLPLLIAVVILGGAALWYALYARVNVLRESALIRLAERLARADFGGHDLEAELSRLTRQRDEMGEDRFDRMIQNCDILDLRGPTTREEVFRAISETMAEGTDHSSDELHQLLREREDRSSTVVRPGLAIPHIFLDDLESFRVVLARVSDGVVFDEDHGPVYAVFAVAAPSGERNFYLKTLVAIAEIAQNPEFDRKWQEARGPEALREVVLAAERQREEPHGGPTESEEGQ